MSTSFRITMSGAEEVPTVATAATGLGTAIFDSVAGTLEYTISISGVDFGPLLGQTPATAALDDDVNGQHFHNGARGAEGPVVLDWFAQDEDFSATLLLDGSWLIHGIWESTDATNSLAAFVSALGAATPGSDVPLYANVHTTEFGGGEIRGQLVGLSTDGNETVRGTTGNDILPGLGGADKIRGFEGIDILTGGQGADKFVFESALKVLNADLVTDFKHNVDEFRLDDDIFKQLDLGALDQDAFFAGRGANAVAHDDEDRIIYDKTTGILSYDKDGNGGAAAKLFADLDGSPDNVDHTDFVVVA